MFTVNDMYISATYLINPSNIFCSSWCLCNHYSSTPIIFLNKLHTSSTPSPFSDENGIIDVSNLFVYDEDEKDVVEEITTTIGKEEYIIQEDIKSEDVPEDFRLVVGKYEGKDIPLIKDNDLKYTLGLLKHKESGDLKWFFYDEAKSKFSKTKTFSPEEVMDYVKLSATEVEENNGYFDQNAILLLSVLGGTLVLLVLVVIVLQVKIMGKKKSSKKAKKNAKQEE